MSYFAILGVGPQPWEAWAGGGNGRLLCMFHRGTAPRVYSIPGRHSRQFSGFSRVYGRSLDMFQSSLRLNKFYELQSRSANAIPEGILLFYAMEP